MIGPHHQTKEIYIPDDEKEPCDVIADMETFKTPIDKAHANGEFIARACNSHYELLDRLENLVIGIGMGWDLEGLIEAANVAIAQARGQQ